MLGAYHYHRGAYPASAQADVILQVLEKAKVKTAFVATTSKADHRAEEAFHGRS